MSKAILAVKSFRIAKEDWEAIEKVASRSGITASEWIRKVSLLQLALVAPTLSATNVHPDSETKLRSGLGEEPAKREGVQGAPSA